MLFGVLATMDSESDGWRRYVALIRRDIGLDDSHCLRRLSFVFRAEQLAV